jgi:hypothetical protein
MDTPASEEDGATIRVIRRLAMQDLVRARTVFIDASPRGKLWALQQRDDSVSPGHHTLPLRIVGTGTSESAESCVEVGAGETRVFRTKKLGWKKFSMAPLGIFFPDRLAPRPWIQLEMEP